MRMSIKEQALTSPYLQFDRNQWAALRDSVPMTLTEEEIARLKGINEDLSLEEVAEIYLPLSRLLAASPSVKVRLRVFCRLCSVAGPSIARLS